MRKVIPEQPMNDNNYNQWDIWNEGKGREKGMKRMVDAYKKRKRKKKVEKLLDNEDHWKGLS